MVACPRLLNTKTRQHTHYQYRPSGIEPATFRLVAQCLMGNITLPGRLSGIRTQTGQV
jgi:hypothetical protein